MQAFYDVFGLHRGGPLEELRREREELRQRRIGGERGLTTTIHSLDVAIREEIGRAGRNRLRTQGVIMILATALAAVVVFVWGGAAVPALLAGGTPVVVAAAYGANQRRQRRRRTKTTLSRAGEG